MKPPWPAVPLRELLTLRQPDVKVDRSHTYHFAGVYSFGRGVFKSQVRVGTQVAYDRLTKLRVGNFVYPKLMAWEGALGVVPPECDGLVVSPEFPVFEIDEDRVLPKFLDLYFRTPSVWPSLSGSSTGTNVRRRRLHPTEFLAYRVPLPPLQTQSRIVARLSVVDEKLRDVDSLRRNARVSARALLDSALIVLWSQRAGAAWSSRLLGDLVTTVSGQVNPRLEPYRNLPHINGEAMEAGTCRLLFYRSAHEDGVTSGKYHFKPGAILYSKIRPYLRKAVQVPFEGICSADVYAIDTISSELDPRFLMYSLVTPGFTRYANELSGRTRMPKLNLGQLLAFPLAYPPRAEQMHIVEYLDRLQSKLVRLHEYQAESSRQLDALRPSILDRAFSGKL